MESLTLAEFRAPPGLYNRWTDIFRRDQIVHVGVMGCLITGTFQGYLKDRIAGPFPYAMSEVFFLSAAATWFGMLAVYREAIPGPRIVRAIVLLVALLPAVYLLHPGTPLMIELAGMRAWAEFPIACLMALTVIRTTGQARAYVGLLLLLCAVTAVYGIYQYIVGPEAALGVSELARARHGTSVFYNPTASGATDFRAFSTFTFPGPFAGMMGLGIVLAAGIAVSSSRSKRTRLLVIILVPVLLLGIAVSGTRAAVIMLLMELLVLGWLRGFQVRQLVLLPALAAGIHVAALLTGGRILSRWESILMTEGELWSRLSAPVVIAARALAEEPLGLGLGRSGVGVPFGVRGSLPPEFFRGSDGDVGRAAVEMGIPGVLLVFLIGVALVPYVSRAAHRLRGTAAEDVALGIGALVIPTGAAVLIGSPLAATPHAIIWWFLLGTLLKLHALRDSATVGAAWGAASSHVSGPALPPSDRV